MPKSGGSAMPLSVGKAAGFLSNTMSLGTRPTSVPMVPSGILIRPTFWPQYTNVTGRQDIGPIAAYGEPSLVTVAQKLQVSAVADETARHAASRQIKHAANKVGRSV